MADFEEITIELDEPAPAAPETPDKPAAAAPAEAEKKPIVTAEEGIGDLKAKLDAANKRAAAEAAARAEAERRANAAAEAAKKSQADVAESNVQLVTNAIETVKAKLATAKAGYVAAMQAGDYDGAADFQVELSTNAAHLTTLEHGLASLKAAPPPPAAETRRAPPADANLSEAEKAARTMEATDAPNSAAWVRAHPEYVNDPRLYRRLIAAHNLAETEGLEVDSPEYIQNVEQRLGISLPGEKPLSNASDPEGGRRAASPPQPPAAPVGRGNGGAPPVTRITLSAEEREAAAMNGLTDEEYARNKAALIKEGRYGQRAN